MHALRTGVTVAAIGPDSVNHLKFWASHVGLDSVWASEYSIALAVTVVYKLGKAYNFAQLAKQYVKAAVEPVVGEGTLAP